MPHLVVVLGPTGAGKSELGLALAERSNGEIVNFDSVQLYRGLDIGSAKLSLAERRGVPHHLVDIADPKDDLTAGSFARAAQKVLTEVTARRRLPVLVGGTGFYLRALLEGLSPAPERNTGLRARIAALAVRRPRALYRYLRWRDERAAARIHPNDLQKLIRAIEITLLAGRAASEMQAQPRSALSGYAVTKIGLDPPREQLTGRLNLRTQQMFAAGLIEETRRLLDSGVPSDAKSLRSLGYRQALAVLAGSLSREQAIADCQLRTRQYAKRQMTWFRREREVHWLQGFGFEAAVQLEALRLTGNDSSM